MYKIAILMSTYNGEKYISEQLNSILNQKDIQFELFIRDDGSSDKTPDIISKYVHDNSLIHFINADNRENLGFNKSFFALIHYAIHSLKDYDLFAFADQDDYWIDTKLSRAVHMIESALNESNKNMSVPLYYYANKFWSDENLNPEHEDDMSYLRNDYFDMFMLPPVYGCTSVFNRALGEITLNTLPKDEFLYDVYMYRLACTMNSVLVADKEAQIYYRRHGNNASGDTMKLSPLKHFKELLTKKSSFHGMQNYITEIYKIHANDMEEEQKRLCVLIIEYDKSFKKRMKLLFWPKAYSRGLKAAVIWIGRVITSAI